MLQRALYHFRSRVGTLWIAPQPDAPGSFWLGIDDVPLGSYHSPASAADDVYMHATGWSDWDELDGKIRSPTDLSEWNRGPA